jgi:osmotically-inducible protein OsmY
MRIPPPFSEDGEKRMRRLNFACAFLLLNAVFGCTPESERAADNTSDKIQQGTEVAKQKSADALTTGKVKTAITTASGVKIDELNVDTLDGKVYLKGQAADAASKQKAEDIAKDQVGQDYTVVNEITTSGDKP